jgi:hypothetical protein
MAMNDSSDPNEARVRSLRRWSENGLEEMTLGVLFCLFCGIFLPGYLLPNGTFLGQHYATLSPYFLAACAVVMGLTLKKVRARFIYPRTGYVVFRPAASRIWIAVAGQGIAAAMALAALHWRSSLPDLSRAWGPAAGLLFAACFFWGGVTYGLPYFNWLAALSLLLGVATLAAGAGIGGAMWVMGGMGVALATDGALRMQRFLKRHPIVSDGQSLSGDHPHA